MNIEKALSSCSDRKLETMIRSALSFIKEETNTKAKARGVKNLDRLKKEYLKRGKNFNMLVCTIY